MSKQPPLRPEHDHQQCVSKALGTAEQLCMLRGVQLTPIRHQVLELIWDSHKAVKAYELLDRIRPLQQAAKPATIYRALDFLIEQGLVHRVESLNAFVGCRCSGQQHEQLLLICKQCQEVEERSAADVMKTLAQEAEQAGFIIHSKAIEIHGICAKCASKSQL
ncbi:MAG: transcriptional repressor [Methylococcaceae bacterium]|nr:transcriptional repressor [Methylococcaceae bacterium]MDP3905004.1 transcriptional repressor [Methylococcaceae bacterium]